MKRKSSRPSKSKEYVWFWDTRKSRKSATGSHSRCFAQGPDFEEDNDDVEIIGSKSKFSDNIQLELINKKAPEFNCYLPLPYELLIKIFRDVVKISTNPIKDLFNLSRVCESFRRMILSDLNDLWYRIDLSSIPMTDNNVMTLSRILFSDNIQSSPLKEFKVDGQSAKSGHDKAYDFMDMVLRSPKMEYLTIKNAKTTSKQATKLFRIVHKSLTNCEKLKSLTISDARPLFGNTKWISDYLNQGYGKHLECLDLSLSMTVISPVLQRSICNLENCPNLKVLDLTTCDCILSNSFDIAQLSVNSPNLEIFRAGNVSFRRVSIPPVEYHFKKLRELSIPIARRDADRDDCLFASIAYGSIDLKLLDIRGSMISAHAIINTPSFNLKELHMDDTCPISRPQYGLIMRKWRESLEILSLVKICCSQTIQDCLENLFVFAHESKKDLKPHGRTSKLKSTDKICHIRELDLSQSYIEPEVLQTFLLAAVELQSIDLTSCRSLPHGCRGIYKRHPNSDRQEQNLLTLMKNLNTDPKRRLR